MFHNKFSLLLGSEMSHDSIGPVMLRAPAGSCKRIMDFLTVGKIIFEECPEQCSTTGVPQHTGV
jgi:hypothetical protein